MNQQKSIVGAKPAVSPKSDIRRRIDFFNQLESKAELEQVGAASQSPLQSGDVSKASLPSFLHSSPMKFIDDDDFDYDVSDWTEPGRIAQEVASLHEPGKENALPDHFRPPATSTLRSPGEADSRRAVLSAVIER